MAFNSFVIYEDSIKFMSFPGATRTLGQFSMEDYGKAKWEERFQGSPTNYSFKTGGSFEDPDNSLELKVQSGTKGVGLINVDQNAKIYPSLFDVEVRALMKMDSLVPNGGKVRLFLTGSKSNIFESFLIFEITETSSGLHFKVMQKTGSGGSQIDFLNFTLNGSDIAAGDTIKVRIRGNKIQKLDYVDESNGTVHNIIAKFGWNGAISSPKAQFSNGAYTIVQFLSPNGNGGSLTSVKISRVLTEWGGDEFGKAAGYADGEAAPKAWAKVINDITGYAKARGVKVILWGDKLLGRELGKSSHGVLGWTADARFLNQRWGNNAVNAEKNPTYPTGQKASDFSTHKAVNYIANKADIIIADWHYRDYAAIKTSPWKWEYPSVDYFKKNRL